MKDKVKGSYTKQKHDRLAKVNNANKFAKISKFVIIILFLTLSQL